MDLKTYLTNLLGGQKAKRLLQAVSDGQPIIITGPQIATGKTTLCEVLRKAGASVFEQWEVYEVNLSKPLETPTPRMADLISE